MSRMRLALKEIRRKNVVEMSESCLSAASQGRLEHFASRNCMDIRGLGEKVVAELVEKLGVRDPADIYNLKREQLLTIGNFKDKSADNLLKSIEESKSRELWRLIFGLGILEIGEQFAKELADKFLSIDALMNADIEEINLSTEWVPSPQRKRRAKTATKMLNNR